MQGYTLKTEHNVSEKEKVKASLPKVVRTSAGLREVLFDEIDRLRKGETNATNANALARLSDQICTTIHMELEVHRHLAKLPDGKMVLKMPEPLALGG